MSDKSDDTTKPAETTPKPIRTPPPDRRTTPGITAGITAEAPLARALRLSAENLSAPKRLKIVVVSLRANDITTAVTQIVEIETAIRSNRSSNPLLVRRLGYVKAMIEQSES